MLQSFKVERAPGLGSECNLVSLAPTAQAQYSQIEHEAVLMILPEAHLLGVCCAAKQRCRGCDTVMMFFVHLVYGLRVETRLLLSYHKSQRAHGASAA